MARFARWKSYTVTALGSITLPALLGALILYLLDRAPGFYRKIDCVAPEVRSEQARQFVRQSTSLFNQIENEVVWSGVFREEQVNAWLAGDFARKHGDLLPCGISQPRVSFADGRVAVAFHIQRGPLSAIICATGRMWLPEPNFIALELDTVRAGVFPVPADTVIRTISSAVKSTGLDIVWKQHERRPVALFRLSHGDEPSRISVDQVDVRAGVLRLAGRSQAHGSRRGRDAANGEPDSSDMSWKVHSDESSRRM